MSTLCAPARFVLALAALLCMWSAASAQQIIEEYGDPLTSYLPAMDSLVQDIRPTHAERGVQLDGTARAGMAQGAVIAANPNRGVWSGSQQVGGVRLATGAWSPTEIDIALPADGPRWAIGRSFNGVQHNGNDSSGYQGMNWFQLSQPELVFHDDAGGEAKDLVYLLYGADRFVEYKRDSIGSDEFKGKNGAAGAFQYTGPAGGEPGTYTLTDQNGNQLVFFNTDQTDTDADQVWGQLWKIVDPEGNTAYVGHASTASTAITNGFNGNGQITTAYDSEGRRYSYAYDGNDRLTEVKAEVDDSGWVEVAKVQYSYYGGAESYGEEGDLKLVSVTTHLTDTGVSVVHKTHYRYWEDSGYHATTNPGYEHLPKYVYESEGLRRYDLADDSTLNDSFLSASVGALESYASAYFEYNSDRTIRKAWFNGECGCSGAGDGTYEFTYDQNDQYSDTGSYDTAWRSRTIVKRPDDSYLTQYFDEVGQPLHQIISDDDPSNTGPQPNLWTTKVTRDASGQVTQVSTPANVTGYTHDDTGASSWEITTSTTVGLVYAFDRVTSGNMTGFLQRRKHKEGTSGTAKRDEELEYTYKDQTIGDVTVVRPLISSRKTYHNEVDEGSITASDYEETTYDYVAYGGDPLAIEVVTTTYPAVDSSHNGSGSATTSMTHYTERGLVDFEKSTDGIITYREYTGGQLTKVIEDADTSGLSAPASGDFDSSGTELHQVAEYAYDVQGRIDETTLPGGRITKKYYSKLADGRLVTLSYPKYVSTPTFHGPVQYTVTNQAGKTEVQAVVGLSGNTSSTALTGHIDETDSDPILAADLGTVESMTTFIYGNSGTQLDEQRLYHVVPGSGAGSDGTNYDATLLGYDDSGHRWRVKEPTGTIRRTVYDLHGRMTESWMGTNDSSFSGGESSGTDNMVKTESLVYDGGSDGGNGLLTSRTLYVEDSTTDQRVTEYVYDLRGRRRLDKRPTAPHTLTDYDNLGRVTATGQYSSYASIDLPGGDTAAAEATNRLALSKSHYDEMGRVWKSTRHRIDQADGSDDDNLESLTWFDSEGQVVKTDGSTLAKTTYDRLGRVTHRFTLARDNDTVYADADDVSGDIVMEESQTKYDADGTVIMRATIERFHDDWGATPTTGALDTNADGDDLLYTAANLEGRIQITASWSDDTGRLKDTVQYGTYGGSNFDRDGISAPARSATTLRTTRVYYDSGRLKSVEDPRGIFAYYEYDDAGRKTKEVRNYDVSVNSGNPSGTDDNVTVLYSYTDGLMMSMTADMPAGTDDQVTIYIYGTTEGTPSASKISTKHLRRATVYPDSTNPGTTEAYINTTSDADVVSYAYNAQGQIIYKKDQAGNVIETEYDDSGRKLHDKVSTLDAGFDDAVKRISTSYDGLGRRTLVTQYDSTAGTTVVDEVKFTYEDWGNVSNFEQDRNSAVGASGSVDDYEVSYTFAKNTTGRNAIRVDQITMPSVNVLTCRYRGNATDRHDTYLSRLTSLDDGATVLVVYDYLGAGRVVGTDYYDVDIESDVHGAAGSYPDLDRFNRITTDKWTRDLATDINFYEIDITYDESSNITLIEDNVHSGFDVEYTIDDVNRLARAEEGTWSGSAITSRTRDQQWTLAPCARVVAASPLVVVASSVVRGEPREASPWLAEAERGVPGGGAPREEGVQGEETDRLWTTTTRRSAPVVGGLEMTE